MSDSASFLERPTSLGGRKGGRREGGRAGGRERASGRERQWERLPAYGGYKAKQFQLAAGRWCEVSFGDSRIKVIIICCGRSACQISGMRVNLTCCASISF